MRDDLHKSSSVGAAWKRWLRSCSRPAEQGEIANKECAKAVAKDWAAEVSPDFVVKLLHLASDPQAEIFSGKFDNIISSVDLGGSGSVIEEQLLARARMDYAFKSFSRESVEKSIADVLQSRLQYQLHALHGLVCREGGKGIESCLSSLRDSAQTVDPSAIARNIVTNNGKLDLKATPPAPVSLEENLLSPKK